MKKSVRIRKSSIKYSEEVRAIVGGMVESRDLSSSES